MTLYNAWYINIVCVATHGTLEGGEKVYVNLLKEMKQNGVSHMMLAAELGFRSPNTLTYKMNGKTRFTLDEALHIAKKFGKNIEELFDTGIKKTAANSGKDLTAVCTG